MEEVERRRQEGRLSIVFVPLPLLLDTLGIEYYTQLQPAGFRLHRDRFVLAWGSGRRSQQTTKRSVAFNLTNQILPPTQIIQSSLAN
jgi:hypothetical protein